MFLFWRVWHLISDIIFLKGESLISTSVVFLQNYLTPMNGNSKLDSKEKGKAVCYPEHVGSSLAAQSDKKGKISLVATSPRLDKTKCGCRF
jgi:hypothetical protein